MSGLEKYQKSNYNGNLQDYYETVETKGLVDHEKPIDAGFIEYNANLHEKLFKETSFEDRTKYYFEDTELMRSSAVRYKAISEDNDSINDYAKKYTYHGARKRKGYAKDASGKFSEAADLEEKHQRDVKRGAISDKKDFDFYKHREKVIRLRMEAMINIAKLKSKDEKDETVRILKAKHVCLLALRDQLRDISSHNQKEGDSEKFVKAGVKLSDEIEKVENELASNVGIQRKNAPGVDMLTTGYGSGFRDRITEDARRSKKTNSKSRLYAKEQNSKNINIAANRLSEQNTAAMRKAMTNRKVSADNKEMYQALSSFMLDGKNEKKNRKFLDDFLGTNKDAKTGEVFGRNRKKAMDHVLDQLLAINAKGISLKNDSDIASNAEKLEDITRKVAAFDSLCKLCPDYLETLSNRKTKALTYKLSLLRDMSNFYSARKELLNDEYYKSHYNDELSMGIDDKSTLEQRAVALKLMKNYIYGNRLISRSVNSIVKTPPLALFNKESTQLYDIALSECDIKLQTENKEKLNSSKEVQKEKENDGYFIRGIKNIPGKKVLLSKYASVFKDKVNEKNRYKQIEDGASDLYIKDQNSKKLNEAFNKIHSEKFNTMIKAMKGRKKGCDRLTYNALSAFMTKEDNKNKSLLDNYLGISVDEKTNEVQGINRKEALDEITRTILEIDITEFDLKDDSAIAEKAESFEDMQNKVGAYDRLLSNNPEYLKELPEETKIQLQNLKVICNYYQSRKDLLNDEYYRTHYDDELSMNMNGKLSREQKQVAQKLMNNFVIGKALRMLSGRDVSTLGNPVLNYRALLLSGLQGQNLFFDNNYKSTDHLMGGIRVDSNNLQLNSGKELYKLFAFSGVSEISADMKKILDVKDDDIKLQKEKAKDLKRGNRDDAKEILKRLKEKLGKEEIAYDVANPLMNCKFSGLILTRILGNLYDQNTAHLSTDDILSMLLKIAAPSLPENQNIKAGSEEAEKINQTFMEGIGEYKKILLDATKSLMGSFGSIPMQLSVEDSMKMAAKYGDLMYIANSFNQDISQLLIGLKSIPGYKFTQEDKELEELNEYYRTSLVSLRITMGGMPFGGTDVNESNSTNAIKSYNLTATSESKKRGAYEKRRFMAGNPNMSKVQLKRYKAELSKKMSEKEYKGYLNGRAFFEGKDEEVNEIDLLELSKEEEAKKIILGINKADVNENVEELNKNQEEVEQKQDKEQKVNVVDKAVEKVKEEEKAEKKEEVKKEEVKKKEAKEEELKKEEEVKKEVKKLALPKFNVNCPVKVEYEKQRKHNCFACSGTAMMNQFIMNQDGKLSNPYGQLDLRGYKLTYKTLDEIKKYMPDFNEENYNQNKSDLEIKTSLLSDEYNSIFDMADFFVTKRKDLCVNRIIYDIPSGKVANRDEQLIKMKTHFLQQAKSVLESGNFVSVRHEDHYLTVVGIEGDKLKVLNSIKGSNEDPNEVETYSLDYIMGITNQKGIANKNAAPFEVTYLEKMKEPAEVLKEVEGVTYDENNGFENAQNISDNLAFEIANLPGQTQGVLGRKKIQGAEDVNIAHQVYLPKLDSAQKNAAIKEAIPEYGRVSEWKMKQYVEKSLNDTLNYYSTLKI